MGYSIESIEGEAAFREECGGHSLSGGRARRRVGLTTWLAHGLPKHGLAELDRIAVLPELRGRGIAAALFQTLLADAEAHYRRHGHFLRKLFLMTHADNLRAQAFYRKMGFAAETTLRDHFYQGKNEIVMSHFRTRENQ